VLTIVAPKSPFREAEVVVVLEPRDVGLLWAWGRAHRRRDLLILRGRLERSPGFELEAANAAGWTMTRGRLRTEGGTWRDVDWGLPGVRVSHTAGAWPDQVRALWQDFERASGGVWRIAVRREAPHLEVHLRPPEPEAAADRVFRTFRELARSVTAT
jgi:hypothetical protein